MPDFPTIRRGTRYPQIPARQWTNLINVGEGVSRITVGPGLRIKRTGRNYAITLAPQHRPPMVTGVVAAGPGVRFKIVADDPPHIRETAPWRSGIHPDHVFAARLLAGEEEPEIVRIAKDWDVRKGPWHAHTIDNVSYRYEATNANWRTAFGAVLVAEAEIPIEEKQVVIPRWLYGSEILAVKPVGGTGVTVDGTLLEWLELPKRVFTRKHSQGDWT